MQSACIGMHAPRATINMLPLTDMRPSDETCLYSTLLFVDTQARKLNMPCACITFDQPLWFKAVEITKAAALNNVVCRLGGFHLLSFLGYIGSVMLGSGLQELTGFVYGAHTVEHMLAGKAVARAIRAHLLIQSALTTLLLHQITHTSGDAGGDGESSTDDDVGDIANLCTTVAEAECDYDNTDILQCAILQKVDQQLQCVKQRLSASSRTATLWVKYIYYVDVCKMFIVAERTGNWHLHLQAVHNMLNLIAATGHTHYSQCARLYLQMMFDLPTDHPWLYDVFIRHGFNQCCQ